MKDHVTLERYHFEFNHILLQRIVMLRAVGGCRVEDQELREVSGAGQGIKIGLEFNLLFWRFPCFTRLWW